MLKRIYQRGQRVLSAYTAFCCWLVDLGGFGVALIERRAPSFFSSFSFVLLVEPILIYSDCRFLVTFYQT